MTSDNFAQAQRRAQLAYGSRNFFSEHSDLNNCTANISLVEAEIVLKNLPTNDPESWNRAFEAVKSNLAPKVAEVKAPPEPEKWPYPFIPEIHTYQDIQRMPSKVYRDLWFDKSPKLRTEDNPEGLTERAVTFRAVVQAILDKTNARRSSSWPK